MGGISTRLWALVLAAGLVAGCSGGGLSLGSLWPFGGGERAAPRATGDAAALRLAAAEVEDATVPVPALRLAAADRGRQGVILRAEGIAPTQGYHSPVLRSVGPRADGIETVELRAVPPEDAEAVGPPRTRLLTVGRFYSNREMADIRGFRIVTGEGGVAVPAP